MSEFSGIWELVGYAHINGELSLVNGEPSNAESQSGLIGTSGLHHVTSEMHGLRIVIDGGSFSESAMEFSDLMFDIEGIQVNDYQPMSGKVLVIGQVGFLMPEGVPDYASRPIENELATRYADGDTMVCDTIRSTENNLLRQVSVITDELYTDRIVLLYRRAIDA